MPDPKIGYDTRYLGAVIGVFLPRFALLGDVTADGAPYSPTTHRPRVHGLQNRRYFAYKTLLPRDQSANVGADYTVPFAAEVTSKSTMTYELDVDPQDLVNPESLEVSVTFPKGWSATSLPAGWQPTAHGAHWKGPVPVEAALRDPAGEDLGDVVRLVTPREHPRAGSRSGFAARRSCEVSRGRVVHGVTPGRGTRPQGR